jgi:hypothetical protein
MLEPRSEIMAMYRIYLVHHDGRLEPDEAFYCRSDEEAVRHLRPPPRQDIRVELWQGGRFVAIAGRGRVPAPVAAAATV